MQQPLDLTKFRKDLTKNLDSVSIGFHDPLYWISTGNYALNYVISGDFQKGIPLGRVSMLAGESGSGKSFLVSGNIARNAQQAGHFVVILDTENALDTKWLQALGVSTEEDKLLKISVTMIDDVAKIITDFVKHYRSQYEKFSHEERPKVVFIIDSLGMLLTPTDVNQFEAGELKGDMGRKPRALNALIRNCVNMFGNLDIGLVATNHTYASQDMFDPDPKITGGSGFVYASSIVVAMRKLKLKEDEDGNKTTDVKGIRAVCKCMKTRYNKPFEQVELRIPWESGLDPYSGLIDLLKQKNLLVSEGKMLRYTDVAGNSTKSFESRITHDLLDKIMAEFDTQMERRLTGELPMNDAPETFEVGLDPAGDDSEATE
jgi:RecA/RadA recombinase